MALPPNPARDLVAFLGQHRDVMEAYAHVVVADAAAAEDAVQEASLFIAERWHDAPEKTEERLRWLKGVVRRKALEARRRFRPRGGALSLAAVTAVEQALDAEAGPSPAVIDRLHRCLDRLSPLVRGVLTARYQAGEDCAAIATRMQRQVSSIYTILKRGRQALAACVGQTSAGGGDG